MSIERQVSVVMIVKQSFKDVCYPIISYSVNVGDIPRFEEKKHVREVLASQEVCSGDEGGVYPDAINLLRLRSGSTEIATTLQSVAEEVERINQIDGDVYVYLMPSEIREWEGLVNWSEEERAVFWDRLSIERSG